MVFCDFANSWLWSTDATGTTVVQIVTTGTQQSGWKCCWSKVWIHSDSPPRASDTTYKLILVKHSTQNWGNFEKLVEHLPMKQCPVLSWKYCGRGALFWDVLKPMKLWNIWAFFSVHCRSIEHFIPVSGVGTICKLSVFSSMKIYFVQHMNLFWHHPLF